MTDYTKTTDFASKDSLPTGDASKKVLGSEIDAEFDNIETASATKYDDSTGALRATQINDSNGNESLVVTATTSAINHLEITNSTTTLPSLGAAGDSTDINVVLKPKGVGRVRIDASLTGAEQGVYVGLDTPISLVSTSSPTIGSWVTGISNAALTSAGARIAVLQLDYAVSATASSSYASVAIRKNGSGLSHLASGVKKAASESEANRVATASSECTVNLDSTNQSFDYYLTGTGDSTIANIALIGYYV